METVISTEETILEAARKVFMQKGFAASRMCDIAKTARINQALLHYYFRTKDKLFAMIFDQESQKFQSNIISILTSDLPFFEKLRRMVEAEIKKMRSAPYLPMFILNEMHSNPERQCAGPSESHARVYRVFRDLVEKEQAAGNILTVCPRQLFLSIMGLTMFPFLAQPMYQAALEAEHESFEQLIDDRVAHVSNMIIRSLEV